MHQFSEDLHNKTMMRERSCIYGRYTVQPDAMNFGLKPLVSNQVAQNGQSALHWRLPKSQVAAMLPGELDANVVTWDTFEQPVI